jgi:hypothetical protein
MRRHVLPFVAGILFSLPLFSQVTRENQVWTSISVEAKAFKRTHATLTLESRWNTNPLMAVRYFPNLALSTRWTQWFSTTVHYRFITSNFGLGKREQSHRLMLDATLKADLPKKFFAGIRFRTGREDEPGNTEGLFAMNELVLRQKIFVRRDFKRHELTLSFEQFERLQAGEVEYYQQRLVLSDEIKLSKKHNVNAFLMYQNLINIRRINFGLGYTFRFRN